MFGIKITHLFSEIGSFFKEIASEIQWRKSQLMSSNT